MNILALLAQGSVESVFGSVEQPEVLSVYGSSGGLITFGSNIVFLLVIAGGLFAFVNVVSAGLMYITQSGDSKVAEKVVEKLRMSAIGLVLMIAAPAIMAIVGWVLFRDSTFFLSPKIQTPTGTSGSSGSGTLPKEYGDLYKNYQQQQSGVNSVNKKVNAK